MNAPPPQAPPPFGMERAPLTGPIAPLPPEEDPTQGALRVLASIPQVLHEGSGETSKAEAALVKVLNLPVYTADHIILAGDLLEHVNGERARLDARRTAITKPLLAAKYSIDDLFMPAIKVLDRIKEALQEKIETAALAIRAANLAAQEEAQRRLQQGDARGAALATQNFQPTQAPAGLSFREKWVYRVVDASLLPREYLTPDVKKIAARVKKLGNKANIPGVVVTEGLGVVAGQK